MTQAGALLAALRQAAERLEGADALGAAEALERTGPLLAALGVERLAPAELAEARALQERCERAAQGLVARVRAQLGSAGQSRRALSAYGAQP